MNRLVKLCVSLVLSLSGLAAAAEATSQTVVGRFNCVLEQAGSMKCHEGHETTPCVCFFDVSAPKETALKSAVLDQLKAMKILSASVEEITLTLYGMGRAGSIHRGWDKITAEQIDSFWEALLEKSYLDDAKDLGNIPMAFSKLANYVIKVSYGSHPE